MSFFVEALFSRWFFRYIKLPIIQITVTDNNTLERLFSYLASTIKIDITFFKKQHLKVCEQRTENNWVKNQEVNTDCGGPSIIRIHWFL